MASFLLCLLKFADAAVLGQNDLQIFSAYYYFTQGLMNNNKTKQQQFLNAAPHIFPITSKSPAYKVTQNGPPLICLSAGQAHIYVFNPHPAIVNTDIPPVI